MYGWIWRHLPGGRASKLACVFVLIAATAAVAWFMVFPWLTPRLPVDRVMPGG